MAFRQFKPEEWMTEIEQGLDYRRKFGIEGAWGELESIYYNVHPSMANDGPNVIMSTGDAILSSLTVPTPQVIVKAEHMEAVDKAPLVETLDNILLRELSIREEVDTVGLHAFLFGVGILKIGFDSEFGFDPRLDVGGSLKMGFTLTQLSDKSDRRIEHDSGVIPGMPWVKAVPPHDIVVPWGTLRLSNTPWIVHRFVRQIDDLKADQKYSNTARITPTLSMEDFVSSYKSTVRLWRATTSRRTDKKTYSRRRFTVSDRGDREIQFVEMFEIHDRRTGRILVVSPGYPDFLRNEVNALQIDNHLPFVAMSFTPKSRSFWTTPDAYYLHAAQMEISDLAVQRTKIRRVSVPKFLYDKGIINDEELQKLMSPEVQAGVAIEPGGDIQKAVMQIKTSPDQLLVLEEEHLRRNVREQIGMSRNQLGEFVGGRKTATEAKIVDRSSILRMSRRGLAIKRLYEETLAVINGIVFEHWTMPRYIEVLGEDNYAMWHQIVGPELRSRYSYEINFTEEAEVEQEKMEALRLYMMLTQDPSVDPVALRIYLIDRFRDPAFSRIFNAEIQNAMRAMRLAAGLAGPQGAGGAGGAGAQPGLPEGGLSEFLSPNGAPGGGSNVPSLAERGVGS